MSEICTRRVAIPMTNSTYNRWRKIVRAGIAFVSVLASTALGAA
jgi:hypothetical protein